MSKLTRAWVGCLSGVLALLSLLSLCSPDAFAQGNICNAGPQTVTGVIVITQPCTVTGDLTIQGNGTVFVNYRGAPDRRFTIAGNLVARGRGTFYVAGGVLEFQQQVRQQREIQTYDDASLVVVESEIVTSQNDEPKFMYHRVRDRSQATIMYARLNYARSWLLTQIHEQATVRVVASQNAPSELYLRAQATLSVQDSVGQTVWMELNDHSSGRFQLPEQVDGAGFEVAYSFSIGRRAPTLQGIGWQLDLANSKAVLGIESHSGSRFHIDGFGLPLGGELKVSFAIIGGTHTLDGLSVGLVNMSVDDGRLVLDNVRLGLTAWQIYTQDAEVLITHSTVNEIGVHANSHVRVEDSILQIASLASLGGGSVLEVHNSQIYNQGIDVGGDGRVSIVGSAIHGTSFQTSDARARIEISDSAFLPNPPNCSFTTMFDNLNGVPRCNAFIPPAAMPKHVGPGVASCVRTAQCAW